jgi:predicted secreted hydrolase
MKPIVPFAAALAFLIGLAPTPTSAQSSKSSIFPTTPHKDSSIEWWYLFSHLTTKSNRHLAVVISFFRFASPLGSPNSDKPVDFDQTQDHYLIAAVTDEDTGEHQAFSMADKNTLTMMRQAASLGLLADPHDKDAAKLLAMTSKNEFPDSTVLIKSPSQVFDGKPIGAQYGNVASIATLTNKLNTYTVNFAKQGKLTYTLNFTGVKPPMEVGGTGLTGIVKPQDMKYVSLTQCSVKGEIGLDGKANESAVGTGWFDHQWGSSWTTTSVGWDWFGLQLDDGRDILLFRQRHLADGSIFAPLATIEDKTGHLTVTHNIVFRPSYSDLWGSPDTKVVYPLGWSIELPDQHLILTISALIPNQEQPALWNAGGAIWEGTVNVSAINSNSDRQTPVLGSGYMELVGYGAPAVAAMLPKQPAD